MSASCQKRTHAPQQTRLFDYLVGNGDGGIVWAIFRLSTCSNLAARRSGSVAAEWRFGTEPADQVRRDLGNAAHAEQCHVAIHLILQQGKRALHARLASSHRREQQRPTNTNCAPSASALSTSVPRRTPPSSITVMPFASAAISGSVRSGDSVWSSCRPP